MESLLDKLMIILILIVNCQKSRDMPFYVGANYIFGLPDDNHGRMKETLDLSLRLDF